MNLIFGLGNPEVKYEKTRHNTGFIVLDSFALKNNLTWRSDKKFNGELCDYKTQNNDFILVKPLTFMNDSGSCVYKVINYFGININDVLIVHDDVDLNFGRTKKQFGGSSAGHHGIEDIVSKVKTHNFWRYRIGVGRPKESYFDVEDWVLTEFTPEELTFIKKIEIPLEF